MRSAEQRHERSGMETLIVSLSSITYARLRRRAAALGKPPEVLSRDILEAALRPPPLKAKDTPEILEAAGMRTSLGPGLRAMIVRDVPLGEVRASLAAKEGPTLSDIVLEQRGPKE